jgi:hypothetical protein
LFKSMICLLTLAVATTLCAAEADCSIYALNGFLPGISLEEAQAGERTFNEMADFRGDLGYRRYEWQNRNKAEKIELHVDTNHKPPRVIGVATTVPSADIDPDAYIANLSKVWGPPAEKVPRGGFTLFTWHDEECDVSIRATRMNVAHQVGVWIGVNSISFRDDFTRRKKERREQQKSGGAKPIAPAEK